MTVAVVADLRARHLRELFKIANAFDLNQADRHEVAVNLLDRNVNSWNDLDLAEVARLLDAFRGAMYVATIKMERVRGQRI